MKIVYNSEIFRSHFKSIIHDSFGDDATMFQYKITPVYDPKKSETGEDSAFRLIILSKENIEGKVLPFEDAFRILTSFEPHYPTKIEVNGVNAEASSIIEIKCSTRVRKPSAIANIESKYAPFSIIDDEKELTD